MTYFKILFLLLLMIPNQLLKANSGDKLEKLKIHKDKKFGLGTDWDYLLGGQFTRNISFCEDGSFFIANTKRSKIYKFNVSGKLIKEIGRVGQGPGDIYRPSRLGILDNKLIVVNSLITRRISIFKLDGEFIKEIKPDFSFWDIVQLSDNLLVCKKKQLLDLHGEDLRLCQTIFLFNIKSLNYKKIYQATFNIKQSQFNLPYLWGNLLIKKIDNQSILIGNTIENFLNIFTINGKLKKRVDLNIERVKITRSTIDEFFRQLTESMLRGQSRKSKREKLKLTLKRARNNLKHPKYFPNYNDFFIDSKGTIHVWIDFLKQHDNKFHVYSLNNEFIKSYQVQTDNQVYYKILTIHNNAFYLTLDNENNEKSLARFYR